MQVLPPLRAGYAGALFPALALLLAAFSGRAPGLQAPVAAVVGQRTPALVQVDVRCNVAPDCGATATLAVTAGDGTPTGGPPGTLRVSRSGSCPDGADVHLDWSDSARFPATFRVLRADRPGFDPEDDNLGDVDGALTHIDENAACDGGSGWPWRGGNLYFYSVIDRNACTGEPINDR